MNKQILIEELTNLDLSHEEALLYVHLQETGPRTQLQLARELSINRTKIYRLIDSLTQRKLVEESNTAWGKKIRASNTDNLKLITLQAEKKLHEQKIALPDIISTLSSLTNTRKVGFEVIHYKGVEGIQQVLWNELKAKEVLVVGLKSINDYAGNKFSNKHRDEAVARGVQYKEILNAEWVEDDTYETWNNNEAFDYEHRLISESKLRIRHAIQVFNDSVSIINFLDKEYSAIEIKNKPLADMQRQIFWQYWNMAKEPETKK